jgi:hypothetical protein
MNRREVLQRTAAVLGYAVTGPALAGIMNGCKPAPELTYTPDFFTEAEAQRISLLVEILLPRTDTPGALDAGVPGFIDDMLRHTFPAADQEAFRKGLTEFNEEARKAFGDDFEDARPEDQAALVKKLHDTAMAGRTNDNTSGWWGSGQVEKPFIIKVKELTLIGFFTSEAGATQVLQYNQVPGPYQGCVPLATVGKTWAT